MKFVRVDPGIAGMCPRQELAKLLMRVHDRAMQGFGVPASKRTQEEPIRWAIGRRERLDHVPQPIRSGAS